MSIKWGYKSINGDYVFQMVENLVKEYKQNNSVGEIIDLGVGDVKFIPPKEVLKALKRGTEEQGKEESFCGYGNETGFAPLKKLIKESRKIKGEEIFEDEIFITSGAKPGINEILEFNNFKRALIFNPTYPLYNELCNALNIEKVFLNENCNLKREIKGITNENKVNLVFLCSPNNPTGKVYSEKELKIIIDYALNNESLVLIDCAYSAFCEKYPDVYKIKGAEKCVVEVRSFSKSISYTGLRCGYTVIKRENPLNAVYKNFLSLKSNGINIISQKGACAFYSENCQREISERLNYYRENGEILKLPFKKAKIKVIGGKYAPYLVCYVKNGEQFQRDILKEKGVVVTPLKSFGEENAIRISLLVKREVAIKGQKAIDEFLEKYNKIER